MSDIVTKCCTLCKQEKPLTDYYYQDGKYTARCKVCICEVQKARYIRKSPPPPPDGYKRCPRCQQTLPATTEFFHSHKKRDGSNRDGLNTYCKPCHLEYEQIRHEQTKIALPETITCYECSETKPATSEFFSKKRATANGLDTMCKICRNTERKGYYYSNDELRAKINAKNKEYQKSHREEKKAYWKQWYHDNKEQQRAYKKVYRRQEHDRERRRVEVRNRRARKRQAPGTHTRYDIQKQYERQKGRCYWCHTELKCETRSYHVDHVIPLSRGGTNWPDNLVIACHVCNESRNNRLPHEWPQGGHLM